MKLIIEDLQVLKPGFYIVQHKDNKDNPHQMVIHILMNSVQQTIREITFIADNSLFIYPKSLDTFFKEYTIIKPVEEMRVR